MPTLGISMDPMVPHSPGIWRFSALNDNGWHESPEILLAAGSIPARGTKGPLTCGYALQSRGCWMPIPLPLPQFSKVFFQVHSPFSVQRTPLFGAETINSGNPRWSVGRSGSQSRQVPLPPIAVHRVATAEPPVFRQVRYSNSRAKNPTILAANSDKYWG